MKILMLSRFGDSYGLGMKLGREAHEVEYWIEDRKYADKGKGIGNPKRIQEYPSRLRNQDVVIADMSGIGDVIDSLKKQGVPILGGGKIADKLEKDRMFAMELMEEHTSASLAKYQEFTTIEQCIEFLEDAEEVYCFKPDDMPTDWTFVPKRDDNATVISHIRTCPKKSGRFVLQERVEGIEISTEGWMTKKGWIPWAFNHTIERKRFLEGDKGPNCGCMGNVVWKCGEDKLVKNLLIPFTDMFMKAGYVGPVDVNAKVTEDDIWFLEFTPRFGYDAIQAASMLMGDAGGFFRAVVTGDTTWKWEEQFSLAVRLSLPPYPASENNSELAKSHKGRKVISMTPWLEPWFLLADVMMNKEGEYVSAGTDGVVGVAVAVEDDIEHARRMAYSRIEKVLDTRDVQFRSDIGKGDQDKINQLIEWGYL